MASIDVKTISVARNQTAVVTFDFSSLVRAALEILKNYFKHGRDLFKAIAKGFTLATQFIGDSITKLLDSELFWRYAKFIPLINTVFGSQRALRQLYLGKHSEALKSLFWGLGGIAAVWIPFYICLSGIWGLLLSSTINNVIGGTMSFLADLWNDERLRTATCDQLENELYQRIIRVTPLLAAGYCPVRALAKLLQNDKREATASGMDLLVAGVSIALGYVLINLTDFTPLMETIDDVLGNTTNAFIRVTLNCMRHWINSGGVHHVAGNLGGEGIRHWGILDQADFPYYLENETNFMKCLKNPGDHIKGDYNKEYMRKELIKFVMKCLLVPGYKDLRDDNGNNTVEMAFEGGNPIVLQVVLSVPPAGGNWMTRARQLLNQDQNNCAKFILKTFLDPNEGQCCKNHRQFESKFGDPPVSRPTNPLPLTQIKGSRVLCIDGGGTRGLVSLEILTLGGGTIAEFFDIIVGTSTGGLIALLLVDNNRRVSDIRDLYFKLKDRVFSGRKGNLSEFNKLLSEFFGDRMMGSIPSHSTRVVITTSVIGSNRQLERKCFTNFHEETAFLKICDVARCTSAAPSYFPPVTDADGVIYVDGGLTSNNPVFAAFHHNRYKMENAVVVSVGTGRFEDLSEPIRSLHISRSPPGNLRMAMDGNLNRFVEILINQASKADGEVVSDALLLCESSKAYFYRLNPILSENIQLDSVDDEELVNAIWHSKVFVRQNWNLIQEIGNKLSLY